MEPDSTLWNATIWVVLGLIIAAAGNLLATFVAQVPVVGVVLSAGVWLVAHVYAVKFGLTGIAVLVEEIVSAELDRRGA